MRQPKFTVSAAQVQQQAVSSLEAWLSRQPKTLPVWLAPLLIWMAARKVSLSLAAQRLAGLPGAERVRQIMHYFLPAQEQLLPAFQQSVGLLVPQRLRRRKWHLAIDLHDRPYYGRTQDSLRRGQAKRGTKRFFSYATCCVVSIQQRWTIAMVPVPASATLVEVVDQLLDQIRAQGWKIRCLLLDRGFYAASVIACLQRRRVPFVMPMIRRGKRGKRAADDTGTQRFFRRGCEGHFTHTWVARGKPTLGGPQVTVRVACAPPRDRRRCPWVYAYWGVRWSLSYLNKLYRQRFGIESSYRQLGQGLANTTSRNATYRLLLVLLSLLLRNVWVWCQQANRGQLRLVWLFDVLAQATAEAFGLRLPTCFGPQPHPSPQAIR